MSYYMGDFYAARGSGVRGDPGFFSFLGGLAQKAAGFIPGVGPAASGVLGGIRQALSKRVGPMASSAITLAKKHPIMTAAGGAGIIGGAGAIELHHKRAMAGMKGGGGGGRHRRMRVTNPKALRRAIRRTHGFAKLAMRTIHLVHPQRKVRFGGFKKRRKRAA